MKKGFTLIELLVAVSILAVLSTAGITVFQGTQSKARDAVRKNDLSTLATALAIYHEQNGKYVVQSSGADITSCPSSSDTTSPFYTLIAANLSVSPPKDPKTGSFYCYISVGNGQSFRLFAKLENCTDSDNTICPYHWNYSIVSEDLTIASAPGDSPIASAPTASPTPSTSPIASTSPSPAPSPALTASYIQTNVGCGASLGLTPDQICQREVSSTSQAVVVSGTTVAKGYWWKECGGASVSNCNGLDCTVNDLDCINTPGIWGSQQPYPSQYLKAGNNTTVYNPTGPNWSSCGDYSPGWTMRVYCSPPTSPSATTSPTPSPSPTPSTAACADGTNDQVYSTSMVGCNGSVNWTNKGALCAAGSHVCSFAEYAAGGGQTTQPTSDRWLSDTSSYAGFAPVCSSTLCGSTACYLFPPGSNTGLLAKGSVLRSYSSSCSDISANNVGYIGTGGLTFYDASGTTCCN